MKHHNKNRSYIALAIAAALTNNLAFAQEATDASPAAQNAGLERIEVTARKSLETLQNVPVAVTSVGAEQLAQGGISVMTEIQQFSPNTTLQNSRGTNSTLTAFIRGVGQEDPLWGYEPGVGIYVDDVYFARPQGAVLDIIDVERIEVLRGPQGTLYGKNSIGGAIKYVTKKMSGDMEFDLQGTFGDYGRQDYKVAGKIPVIDDKLYVGFALASLTRDGYGDFIGTTLSGQDSENYNKDIFAGRVTVEFTPTDDLFLKFVYDQTVDDSNAKGGHRLIASTTNPSGAVQDNVYDSYSSLPTANKVENSGWSLTAEYYINDEWSVKSVTAARKNDSETNIDFDNTLIQTFDVPAIYDDEQFSQEFQLNYNGDNLNLVSGVYYFDGKSCGQYEAIFTSVSYEKSGCNNSESYAIYSQGSYNVTDALSFTLGARFTEEEKNASVYDDLFLEIVYPHSGWIPGYVRPDLVKTQVLDGNETWSRFTPKLGVEYQVDEDMMIFASYSQGFKSGTFNPRASTNEPAANPEIVDSVELGVKSEWFDKLRVNATIFALEHKDRQYTSLVESASNPAGETRLGNIGQSEAIGLELDIEFAATESLNFNFAFGYIDSEFTEVLRYDGNGGFDDISDVYAISNTPDMTANLGATYDIETDIGSFVVNGNYYYRGDYQLLETKDVLIQDGYGLLNLGVNWYSNDGEWTAALHWKNITDEEYIVGAYPYESIDNSLIAYYGDPSTVALTVGYSF
ncbi:MAG: ligand-gated channel protein [Colwellia sp.]|nr:MAG: ligand-gated channel protein [Colwellia sp.]